MPSRRVNRGEDARTGHTSLTDEFYSTFNTLREEALRTTLEVRAEPWSYKQSRTVRHLRNIVHMSRAFMDYNSAFARDAGAVAVYQNLRDDPRQGDLLLRWATTYSMAGQDILASDSEVAFIEVLRNRLRVIFDRVVPSGAASHYLSYD